MKIFSKIRSVSLLVTLLMVVMIVKPTMVMAGQETVNLGTASTFAVLASSAITNTGDTTISGTAGGDVDGKVGGNVGLFPGTAFDPASVSISDGKAYIADEIAKKAKEDLDTAYIDAAGRKTDRRIGTELGGQTLEPGTYDSESGTFEITGNLTLDAKGDPNAVFIFKTKTSLVTASHSNVTLINSARFCRTFWQVGSSATLGEYSYFEGHIFALASITANTGAEVHGQLLARTGSVTLLNNKITNGFCETITTPPAPAKATLHIIKNVVNDNGAKAATDFRLHLKSTTNDIVAFGDKQPGNAYKLVAGDYVISEEDYPGYTASYSGDSDSTGKITLDPGDEKTVIITNTYTPPVVTPAEDKATLNVIKKVVNANGGTKVAADFKLYVKSTDNNFESSAQGVELPGKSYSLDAGNYVVSEDASTGYNASYEGSDSNGAITLEPGKEYTVTITNTYTPVIIPVPPVVPPTPLKATLTVVKHVLNDNGGRKVAADFNLFVKTSGNNIAKSQGSETGTTYTLDAGDYVVGEDTDAGYAASYTGDGVNGAITLAPGDSKTVTITNDDIPKIIPAPTKATLKVIKHVLNDNGGKKVAADFKLHVKTSGSDVSNSPAQGSELGTTYTLNAGTYVVSEDAFAGYTASYSGSDSSGKITLVAGKEYTVTITNNDVKPASSVNGSGKTELPESGTHDVSDTTVNTPNVPVTTTVTGGTLPKTSSHFYELLFMGAALTILGALGWVSRKRFE